MSGPVPMPTLPPFALCILLPLTSSVHPPRPPLLMRLLTQSKVAKYAPLVTSLDVLPVTESLKELAP